MESFDGVLFGLGSYLSVFLYRRYCLIAYPLCKRIISTSYFVGLIVMHMYVGTSELHWMLFLCSFLLFFL